MLFVRAAPRPARDYLTEIVEARTRFMSGSGLSPFVVVCPLDFSAPLIQAALSWSDDGDSAYAKAVLDFDESSGQLKAFGCLIVFGLVSEVVVACAPHHAFASVGGRKAHSRVDLEIAELDRLLDQMEGPDLFVPAANQEKSWLVSHPTWLSALACLEREPSLSPVVLDRLKLYCLAPKAKHTSLDVQALAGLLLLEKKYGLNSREVLAGSTLARYMSGAPLTKEWLDACDALGAKTT